ncbi:DNA mismatch repair endonuclease MutL [Bdellovibrio sp. HCB337]|uniref:DNA mismatch repair endonuclease MutL n=1 Tax=Bdellovibrio sp. HCB337 TaxID=3394358 RepID=UPI0039A689D1
MSIQLLPPEVVDQIAAGEVVERPSHLVKELVENSIDAGATSVTVEFADGGRYVKVVDNGKGIPPEELPKALERFATSKISKSDDLWSLRTFGFRGEALASIAAVSKLNLTSRTPESTQAHQLLSEFGKKTSVDPVGGSAGTSITVQELFGNVPARLKFLKSDAAEATQIKTTLKALALAHADVEFRIYEKNELAFFWPACKSRKDRVEQILDVKPMYDGHAQRENVTAYAVFADPHQVAKTGKNIWLFAQNRWVQDRSMQAAVMEAFRNLLMHGEYPIAAVWVEIDPEYIDVNIHPTKSQVKFHNPSLAFRAVQAAVRDTLEKAPWVPQGKAPGVALPLPELDLHASAMASATQAAFSHQDFQVTQFKKKEFPLQMAVEQAEQRREALETLHTDESNPFVRRVEQAVNPAPQYAGAEARDVSTSMPTEAPKYWSSLEVLGQANLTYIICQSRDKLVFVDQHAAHERVVFERLMTAWRGGKMEVQEFLFPLAVDLTPDKVEALQNLFPDLEKLGVFVEVLGPGTVGVKAAPSLIKESVMSSVLDKMATEALDLGGSFRMEKVIGDLCATMACHSVVRAGQALSTEQMKNLLSEMDDFPLSSFCPHGRPVSVEYPYAKLEKDFGRIV